MRKLVAPAIGAIATVVLLTAPTADAKGSKWTDIRVVSYTGETLAEHRQYTEWVNVKTSVEAECFGPSNPSTGESYKVKEPTVLGALIDASKMDNDLKPLRITDAFFSEFGSFGVCGMGSFIGSPTFGEEYWYSAVNGEGATAGPNQISVSNGDEQLWYFATGAEAAIAELVVKTPDRAATNEPFTVKAMRVNPDGSKGPAEGVTVAGESTDSNGEVEITPEEPGGIVIRAVGGSDDVPSAITNVCVADVISDCPKHIGIRINGSPADDEIKSTKGADEISCGKGKDVVREAQNSDEIANDCEKVKNN